MIDQAMRLAKGEASVRGIFKGLCQKIGFYLTKGEALVRGIFKGLCPLERRQ